MMSYFYRAWRTAAIAISVVLAVGCFAARPENRWHSLTADELRTSTTATSKAVTDLQSTTRRAVMLFVFQESLAAGKITAQVNEIFEGHGTILSEDATLESNGPGEFTLVDGPWTDCALHLNRCYSLRQGAEGWQVWLDLPLKPLVPQQPNRMISPSEYAHRIPGDAYASSSFHLHPLSNDFVERQHMQSVYDNYSWQIFLTLNWVGDEQDQQIEPVWSDWITAHELFQVDGSPPSLEDDELNYPTHLQTSSHPAPVEDDHRVLFGLSSTDALSHDEIRLAEFEQAFSSPLWDQKGNLVYYEILVNDYEAQFIRDKCLYNLDGQIEHYNSQSEVVFVPGTLGYAVGGKEPGPVELKLAWKIMDDVPDEIAARYYMQSAIIYTEEKEWKKVTIGLVGMHIAHKILSSRQWAWSTFEHIDNLTIFASSVATDTQYLSSLTPSFYDPECATCPVNVPPEPDQSGLRKTQVTRVMPIPATVQNLNQEMQSMLSQSDSVWQYYQLIGTQYATAPKEKPTPSGHLPDSVTNRSGGRPAPIYLVNAVMETYFQKGNQPAKYLEQPGSTNMTEVFGTESCMGCHYSAGIAKGETKDSNGQRKPVFAPASADFSWILQTEAHWRRLLFSLENEGVEDELNELALGSDGATSEQLRQAFANNGILLPPLLQVVNADTGWHLTANPGSYGESVYNVVQAKHLTACENTDGKMAVYLYR